MKLRMKKTRLIFKSDDLIYYSLFLLIVLTCIPITQCLPSIVRMPIQVFSILLFLCGLILKKDSSSLVKYFLIVVFFVSYVFSVWKFKQSFFTISYNIMASVQFCMFGTIINDNWYEKKRNVIINIVLFIMVIVAVTTIIGLIKYPLAARELGRTVAYTRTVGDFEQVKWNYRLHNIAGWSQIYGMVYISPIGLLLYKKSQNIIYIICSILLETCIILSQITFAMIISFLLVFLVGIGFNAKVKSKIALLVSFILLTCLFIQRDAILKIMIEFTSQKKLEFLSRKLRELYLVMNSKITGDAELRFSLYMRSFKEFLNNPIYGNFFDDNKSVDTFCYHSDFFDYLALYGVVGFLVLIIIIIYYIKYCNRFLVEKKIPYIYLVAIFLLFILNPIWYSPQIFIGSILIPILLYRKNKKY